MTASNSPVNGVTITNREIFDAVNQTKDAVRDLTNEVRHVVDDVDDLEKRVNDLEGRRWPLPSIAVLLSLTAVAVAIAPRMM